MAVSPEDNYSVAKKKLVKKSGKELSLAERRFGVILERIESQLQLALKGHDALREEFKKQIGEFRHEMRNEVAFLKLNTSVMTDRQKDLEVKMDRSSKDIFEYFSNLDDYLKEEIADLKKKLGRKTELKRMETLEADVTEIKEQLAKIK